VSVLPVSYHEPLYRPPSEAGSLILQATVGCSWNRCTFCEMYTDRRFRPRPTNELLAEIAALAAHPARYRRVFLADGDALVLSNRRLLPLLGAIRDELPWTTRVACYATPANLLHKSVAELTELREAGLRLVYLGIESGDDEILERIAKGAGHDQTVRALNRAAEAGIKRSVMIINGLGGRALSERHADASATLLNATRPEYASVLALMLHDDGRRHRAAFGAGWQPLDEGELLIELRRLLAGCELERTIFRSNHASNRLLLAGTLNRDQPRLLAEIDAVLDGDTARLRPAWGRRL
jgi:radical SAM superfamily enzyme YgiQ (UPF0313 family)